MLKALLALLGWSSSSTSVSPAADTSPLLTGSSTSTMTAAFDAADAAATPDVSPLTKLLSELNAQIAKCEEKKKEWVAYQDKLSKGGVNIVVKDPQITPDDRSLFAIYWEDIKNFAKELVTPENEELKRIFLKAESHIDDLKVSYDNEKNDSIEQCKIAIEIQDDLIELLQTFIDHIKSAEDHKEGMLRAMKELIDTVAKLSSGIILPEVNLGRVDEAIERDLAEELADEDVSRARRWVDNMSASVSPFQTQFSSSR
jgi:hypothetical protein